MGLIERRELDRLNNRDEAFYHSIDEGKNQYYYDEGMRKMLAKELGEEKIYKWYFIKPFMPQENIWRIQVPYQNEIWETPCGLCWSYGLHGCTGVRIRGFWTDWTICNTQAYSEFPDLNR